MKPTPLELALRRVDRTMAALHEAEHAERAAAKRAAAMRRRFLAACQRASALNGGRLP